MKKILYNGQVYRVRYIRKSGHALDYGNRSCSKCAFMKEFVCPIDCTVYYKRNRTGRITHYSYFRLTNPNSPWPDIAIGLVGLAIAILLGVLKSM